MTKRLRILALGLMIVVLLATLSGCSVDGVKDKIMGIIGPYLPGCQHEGGEATCTTQAVCEKCGVAYGNVLGHDIVVDAAVAPDCENAGLTEGKHCSRCDYTSGREVVDALGHNVVVDAAVPATCYSTGLTEGKHCDRCEEVIVAQTETTMIPHTYDEEGFDETCNAEGCTHVRTCAHDGEKTVVAGTAPTCTVSGLTDGEKCAICGDVTKAQEVINALGHDMAEATCTAPATCKRGCGHTVGTSKGHSYDDGVVTTAPTCTEKGVKTYTCSACGDSYTEEVAAAGHSYTPVVTAPTCTEDGYITYTCSCGDSYTAPGQASTGHAWGEWVIDVEPTEETEGAKHRDCTNCDEVETAVIPELSHVHSYTTTVVAPTCTEKGYTKHTCRCGDTYNTDEVDALGHDKKTVTVDPTCTEAGSTTTTCTRCDYNNVTPIPATNHTYESVVTAPKCEEEGYTTHTCHCGDSYVDTYVDALGHKDEDHNHACDNGCNVYQGTHADGDDADHLCDYGCGAILSEHSYSSEVTAPTCTVDGYTTYTCACGDTYKADVVVAKGHSYSSEVITEATCDTAGLERYTCANCCDTYTKDIPATGHTWVDNKCECGAKKIVTSTTAEKEFVFDFGANGKAEHNDAGQGEYKTDKSFTVDGYTLTLTGMSKVYGTAYDATGNSCIKLGGGSAAATLSFTVPEDVTKVVINIAKYKANTSKVDINGTTYTLTKNSNDGQYDAIEIDTSTNKTITLKTLSGGYRSMINSIVFVATVKTETVVIIPAHDCAENATEPTCEDDAVCNVCHEVLEGTSLGHSYDEVTHVCGRCGETDPDACFHPDMESVVTKPTCTAGGYTTHTCPDCNYTYTDSETESTGHKDENGDFVCDYGCGEKMLPAAGTELTVKQAIDIAKLIGSGFTTQYKVTGTIKSIANTTYGNMTIVDETGEIYLYGFYGTDGTTRYDKLATKPAVGDTVTVLGYLGTYNDSVNMGTIGKNNTLVEHIAHEHDYEEKVTAPTCTKDGYTTHTCTICNGYYVDSETEALGHTTENGTCERCGQTIGGDAPAKETFTADFSTISNTNTSYVKSTTTSGWVATNCAVLKGGTSDSSPAFKMIGDESNRAFCMNGKTTAKGMIVSPTLSGGISKLTFSYGHPFGDSKMNFTVTIKQDGTVVATKTISKASSTKYTGYEFEWDLEAEGVAVKGDFTIEITNNSPSNSTSNKDRVAIWDLEWTTNP